VERWIPHANRRRDLFGFGDVLAIDRREPGFLLVQCTSLAHVVDRLWEAVQAEKSLPAVLHGGLTNGCR